MAERDNLKALSNDLVAERDNLMALRNDLVVEREKSAALSNDLVTKQHTACSLREEIEQYNQKITKLYLVYRTNMDNLEIQAQHANRVKAESDRQVKDKMEAYKRLELQLGELQRQSNQQVEDLNLKIRGQTSTSEQLQVQLT